MKRIRLSVKIFKQIRKYAKKHSIEKTMDKICEFDGLLEVKNDMSLGTYYQRLRVEHLWRGVLFIFYTEKKLKKKQRKFVIEYLQIGSKKKFDRSNYFGRTHSKYTREKIKMSVRVNRYGHKS